MIVDVQFLGIPQIKMNDNEIKISLKKSEAILYYLMINKKCSKNEIANLLWGNKNDNSAKINLRVNLHNLRKSFNGYDVIISEGSFYF